MPGEAPATAAGAAAGQRLRVRRVEGAPVVSARLWFPGGLRSEILPGQALLTGRMLAEGTRRRDFRRIADDAEALGMDLASFGTAETHGVAVDALAADWERALDWAAELLAEPAFPEERCDWLRRQLAAELESLGDQPEVRTAWAFLEALYTPHPRSRPLQGTAESLAELTPADCAAFHARASLGGARLAVSGRIDEDAVARRAEELLAGLPERWAWCGEPLEPLPEPPAPTERPAARREVILPAAFDEGHGGAMAEEREALAAVDHDEPAAAAGGGEADAEAAGVEQAQLYVGRRTVDRRHPDFEALELAGVVLGQGAGLTGRIPERIREREGLAYAARVHVVAGAGLDPGRMAVHVGTSPRTLAQAERGVREELARLVEEGIGDDELESARAYLLGREPFGRETARQWADLLSAALHYDLALDDPAYRRDRLAAPDRAAVEAAARRHLDPAGDPETDGRGMTVAAGVPGQTGR